VAIPTDFLPLGEAGDLLSTAVKLVAASHTKLTINIGTDFKSSFTPTISPSMTEGRDEKVLCTLKKECWSKECASFIHYDEEASQW